jgi:hypothetical protein
LTQTIVSTQHAAAPLKRARKPAFKCISTSEETYLLARLHASTPAKSDAQAREVREAREIAFLNECLNLRAEVESDEPLFTLSPLAQSYAMRLATVKRVWLRGSANYENTSRMSWRLRQSLSLRGAREPKTFDGIIREYRRETDQPAVQPCNVSPESIAEFHANKRSKRNDTINRLAEYLQEDSHGN